MMPVMDGVTLCKKIKKNIKTCHIPIILLTAKSSVEDQLEGIGMGADDYITKPFMMNLLEAKISNIIKMRKRLKEFYSQSLDVQPEKIAFNSMDEELLKKAVDVIESNLTEPDLSVDYFAREMGMSRSNLHLKLKAVTGESATDFIKKIRFRKATRLIEENKYSIAEISYMVGFNSPSYFSTSFKKYFGYLPTEYLQRNFNQNK
jgi:YesN/AraC family two-component response regulator